MNDLIKTQGVRYSFIESKRFKTTLISVSFFTPLDENRASNTLASKLMKSGTEQFPDTYSLNRKLASLYGASVFSKVCKKGDNQELGITMIVNDDNYSLNGENTVDEASKLLCDMIFGRYLSKTDYPEDAVVREKRLLCEAIEGKLNDKRSFARNRCEEIMCNNEPFGLSPEGTTEMVNAISNDDIKSALARLVENSFIYISVIGNKEPKSFCRFFSEYMKKVNRSYSSINNDIICSADNIKTVEDKMPVIQGKLVLGLRNGTGGSDKETVADWIMTDIFGGGPYSKLFCNVREKMSLCYYCSARGVRQKGLIFIESGVEEKNIDSAKNAILDQLLSMTKGEFSEKDIRSSKLALCDIIRSVESDQYSLANWYSTRALENHPLSPEEMCRLIENVTYEDIILSAKKYKLDTVYVLRPDGNNKEEK